MVNLFILNETFTNGYKVEILDIISFISILSGILVITIKNPIVSVLSLIALFFSIASYLMLLGLNFIGLSYLLVYVGAVSILFLFILMLINVKISELVSNTNNSLPLAILIAISFYHLVSQILPDKIVGLSSYSLNTDNKSIDVIGMTQWNFPEINIVSSLEPNTNNACYTTGVIWDNNLSEISHISSIGNIMYTSYSIWLILTSIILLLAMVGAIVITIKPKKEL